VIYRNRGVIIAALLIAFFLKWSHRRADEARQHWAVPSLSHGSDLSNARQPAGGPVLVGEQEERKERSDVFPAGYKYAIISQ